jgi:hypothetical protein
MIPIPVFPVRETAEGVICRYYVPQSSLTSVHYCSDSLSKGKLPGHRARWYTQCATGWCPLRTLTLVSADLKILIAAMTFFALLAIPLTPDGCFSSGVMDLRFFPVPK